MKITHRYGANIVCIKYRIYADPLDVVLFTKSIFGHVFKGSNNGERESTDVPFAKDLKIYYYGNSRWKIKFCGKVSFG